MLDVEGWVNETHNRIKKNNNRSEELRIADTKTKIN